MTNTIFEALKPAILAEGIKPKATWEQTRAFLAGMAIAQLRRRNLKPRTAAKWHRLGVMAGAGQLVRQRMN